MEPFLLKQAQAFDGSLTKVFAKVREADLLLEPLAYGVGIEGKEADLLLRVPAHGRIEDALELARHHARGGGRGRVGEGAETWRRVRHL